MSVSRTRTHMVCRPAAGKSVAAFKRRSPAGQRRFLARDSVPPSLHQGEKSNSPGKTFRITPISLAYQVLDDPIPGYPAGRQKRALREAAGRLVAVSLHPQAAYRICCPACAPIVAPRWRNIQLKVPGRNEKGCPSYARSTIKRVADFAVQYDQQHAGNRYLLQRRRPDAYTSG